MPTEFQTRIIEYVKKCPNKMSSSWDIARYAFPEKWWKMDASGIRRRDEASGRGALIAQIRRASQSSEMLGMLPAKTRWDTDIIYYRGQ